MIASHALTGNDIRIEDVWEVAVHHAPVALTDEARASMRAARTLVDRAAENTYGVNTGFGRFVSESIPDDQVEELQLRLLRSHACGVGEPSRPRWFARRCCSGQTRLRRATRARTSRPSSC